MDIPVTVGKVQYSHREYMELFPLYETTEIFQYFPLLCIMGAGGNPYFY
jgi:hypothetical protein